MTDRELMQQALDDICGAKLCEINSMSSRHEMIRLMDKAITALRERLAQEPVATPSRSFEDVYKVQTERLATERERADKAEQNYRLMIKNHVPRNIFDWNTRK
jgi:hypothetical protein